MIPLATTTITVLTPAQADLDAEPYSGADDDDLIESATGVPAVIDSPTGTEQLAGGEQDIWNYRLVCDETPLGRFDSVRDDTTGITYRVVWIHLYPGEHIEAGLRWVQGEV